MEASKNRNGSWVKKIHSFRLIFSIIIISFLCGEL